MTPLDLAMAATLALVLVAMALYCMWAALNYQQPDFRASRYVEAAIWIMGNALLWSTLIVLGGGILAASLGAGWRLTR